MRCSWSISSPVHGEDPIVRGCTCHVGLAVPASLRICHSIFAANQKSELHYVVFLESLVSYNICLVSKYSELIDGRFFFVSFAHEVLRVECKRVCKTCVFAASFLEAGALHLCSPCPTAQASPLIPRTTVACQISP